MGRKDAVLAAIMALDELAASLKDTQDKCG